MSDIPSSERTGTRAPQVSIFTYASILLTWWPLIVGLMLAGAILGLTRGLMSSRVYKSEATFIPQSSQPNPVASLTAQFGLTTVSSGNAWGPAVYVELLRSPTLLRPLALDTFTVTGHPNGASLMDLLKINAPNHAMRVEYTVTKLQSIVRADEDRQLAAVRISAVTEWPELSYALVTRLVEAVNHFNLSTRKSQAAAERQFAEAQTANAERDLRNAENRLREFHEQNRIWTSAELTLTRERLVRNVSQAEQVYTGLLQMREEARIREVRETPVITMLATPQQPVIGEPRRSVRRGILTGMAGLVLGVLIAFITEGIRELKSSPSADAQSFFRQLRNHPFGLRRRTR